ncbi:predicted protein [Naegleria gruberi]|uniref:BOS complex subunit TMEM147 n=1 Tax=Naegleria gruberi TaxID=5762 RepID=D2VQ06_NAEGR|nr:uncharacterized protein NAEGRDRAFT_71119 [Naegleria gruberi]EFC41026.1 predicted protein [Naegleria gruberi]|eukprot:XP_002673770.1 predicted protein [Naegleria gruberi strain NEG-M]
MTFSHFISTFALSFISPYIVYFSKQSSSKGEKENSSIGTERRFSNVVLGIMAFGLTMFCKMFLIAIVIRGNENQQLQSGAINFDDNKQIATLGFGFFITEILKTLIGSLDLIGMFFILSSKWLLGDQTSQLYGCAIGWTMGDNLFNRLLPLWFSTRGLQFELKSLQMGVYSNIVMLEWIAVATFVFLYSKKKFEQKNYVRTMLIILTVFPFVFEIVKVLIGVQCVWCLMGIKACFYGVFCLLANSTLSQYEKE